MLYTENVLHTVKTTNRSFNIFYDIEIEMNIVEHNLHYLNPLITPSKD